MGTPETSPLPELEAGYYLRNFDTLVTFVERLYVDILPVETQAFLRDYRHLSEDAQALYVRMLMRKGELFRCDKLQYTEIQDQQGAIDTLATHRMAERGENLELYLEDCLALLTKPELSTFKAHLGDKKSAQLKKPELIDWLIEHWNADADDYIHVHFPMVQQQRLDQVDILKLCFFGNRFQDLSEFVINELGLVAYENYPLDQAHRFYHSTEQLLAHNDYYQALLDTEELKELDVLEILAVCVEMPEKSDAVLTRRVDRFVVKAARQLERINALREALVLYQTCTVTPARERMARIYATQERWAEAQEVLLAIQQSPWDEEEADFADRFMPKVQKGLGIEVVKPQVPVFETETITCPFDENLSVEQSVQCYLMNHIAGSEAWYLENLLLNGLFGLYFWDEIFAPVDQAFINPFQRAPQDIFTPDFYRKRRSDIDRKIEALEGHDAARNMLAVLLDTYREKFGIANYFVAWDLVDTDILKLTLAKIPTTDIRAIFQRMLSDLKNNRSGFPDLILFTEEGYEFVEVKGPGDRLQKNQIRWLQYFQQHRIPARVVHVEWASD